MLAGKVEHQQQRRTYNDPILEDVSNTHRYITQQENYFQNITRTMDPAPVCHFIFNSEINIKIRNSIQFLSFLEQIWPREKKAFRPKFSDQTLNIPQILSENNAHSFCSVSTHTQKHTKNNNQLERLETVLYISDSGMQFGKARSFFRFLLPRRCHNLTIIPLRAVTLHGHAITCNNHFSTSTDMRLNKK